MDRFYNKTESNLGLNGYNKICFSEEREAINSLINKALLPGQLAFAYYYDTNSPTGVNVVSAVGPLVQSNENHIFISHQTINELLDSVEVSLDKFDTNIMTIRQELLLKLDVIKDEIAGNTGNQITEIDSKITAILEKALEKTTVYTDAKMAEAHDYTDTKVTEAKEYTDEQVKTCTENVNGLITDTLEKFESLAADIEDKANTMLENANDAIDKINSSVSNKLDIEINGIINLVHNETANVTIETNEKISAVKNSIADVQKSVTEVNAKVDRNNLDIKKDLDTAIREINTDMKYNNTSVIGYVDNKIADAEDSFKSEIKDLKYNIESNQIGIDNNINEYKHEVKNDIAIFNSSIRTFVKQHVSTLNNDTNNKLSELKTYVTSNDASIISYINNKDVAQRTYINEHDTDIKNWITTADASLYNKFRTFDSLLKNDINRLESETKQSVKNLESRLDNVIDDVSTELTIMVKDQVKEFNNTTKTALTDLRNELHNSNAANTNFVNAKIQDVINETRVQNSSIATYVKGVANDLNTSINNAIEYTDKKFNESVLTSKEGDASVINYVDKKISEVKTLSAAEDASIVNYVNAENASMKEFVNGEIDKVKEYAETTVTENANAYTDNEIIKALHKADLKDQDVMMALNSSINLALRDLAIADASIVTYIKNNDVSLYNYIVNHDEAIHRWIAVGDVSLYNYIKKNDTSLYNFIVTQYKDVINHINTETTRIDNTINTIKTSLSNNIADLSTDINNKVDKAEKALYNYIDIIDTSLINKINAKDIEIDNKIDSINIDVNNKLNTINSSLSTAVAVNKKELKNDIENLSTNINNKINNALDTVNTTVESLNSSVITYIENNDSAIVSYINKQDSEIIRNVEAINADLVNRISDGDASIKAYVDGTVRMELNDRINAANTSIMERMMADSSLFSYIVSHDSLLEQLIKDQDTDILNKLALQDASLLRLIEKYKAEHDVDVKNITTDIRNIIDTEITGIKNNIDTVKTDVNNKLDNVEQNLISKIDNDITSLNASVNSITSDIDNNIKQSISDLRIYVDTKDTDIVKEFTEADTALRNDLTTEISNTNKKIDSIKALLSVDIASGDANIINIHKQDIKNLENTIDNINTSIISHVDKNDASILNFVKLNNLALDNKIDSTVSALNTSVNAAVNKLDTSIKAFGSEINSKLDIAVNDLKVYNDNQNTSMIIALNKQNAEFTNQISEEVNNLKNYVDVADASIKLDVADKVNSLQRNIDNVNTTLDNKITNVNTELTIKHDNDINAVTNELNKKATQLSNEIAAGDVSILNNTANKLSKLDNKIDDVKIEIVTKVNNDNTEFTNKINSEISDFKSNVTTDINNIKNDIKSADAALTDKFNTLSANTQHILDTNRVELENKMDIADSSMLTYIDNNLNVLDTKVENYNKTLTSDVNNIADTINTSVFVELNNVKTELNNKLTENTNRIDNEISAVKDQVNTQLNNIASNVSAELTNISNKHNSDIYELRNDMVTSDSEITSEMRLTDSKLNDKIEVLDIQVNTRIGSLERKHAFDTSNLTNKINNDVNNAKDSVINHINNEVNSLKTQNVINNTSIINYVDRKDNALSDSIANVSTLLHEIIGDNSDPKNTVNTVNNIISFLEGYTDDTTLAEILATLKSDSYKDAKAYIDDKFSMLIDGDSTTNVNDVIDTFREIEEFLSGIKDTETLTGLLQNAINQAKQYSDTSLSNAVNDINNHINSSYNELVTVDASLNTYITNVKHDLDMLMHGPEPVNLNDHSIVNTDGIFRFLEGFDDPNYCTSTLLDHLMDLKAYIENDYNSKFDNVDASIKDIIGDISNINENIADINSSISNINSSIVNINTSLNNLDTKIDSVNNELDSKIDNLKQYVDNQDNDLLQKIKDTSKYAKNYADGLYDKAITYVNDTSKYIIDYVDGTAKDIYNYIDDTSKAIVNHYDASIRDINNSIDSLDTKIDNNVKYINSHIDASINELYTNLNSSINKVNNNITDAVTKVKNEIDNDITNINSSISNIKNQLGASNTEINNRLNIIENTANTALTNSVTNKLDITKINSSLEDLRLKIDSVSGDVVDFTAIIDAKVTTAENNSKRYTDELIAKYDNEVIYPIRSDINNINSSLDIIRNTYATKLEVTDKINANNKVIAATYVTYDYLHNDYTNNILNVSIANAVNQAKQYTDNVNKEVIKNVADISTKVITVENTLNSLINSDTNGVIDKFNEMKDFLVGIADNPVTTLVSLLNQTEQKANNYTDTAIQNFYDASIAPVITDINTKFGDVYKYIDESNSTLSEELKNAIDAIEIPVMTATTLGIAKVGYKNVDNKVKVEIDGGNNLYSTITKSAIESALGYTPVQSTDLINIALPVATSNKVGGIEIGYTNNDRNIGVTLSNNKAYVSLTEDAIVAALGYKPSSGYTLPVADNEVLGGIKLGYNRTYGDYNVPIKLDGNQHAYAQLTADAIASALGYMPSNSSIEIDINRKATDLLIGGIRTGYVSDSTHKAVELNAEALAFVTIPTATSTTYGTVMLGDDMTITKDAVAATTGVENRVYPILKNSDNKLVVSVPWVDTDTSYNYMTSTVSGIGRLCFDDVQTTAAELPTTVGGRTYGVLKDALNHLVVNIPWTDTTYGKATMGAAGIVKLGSDSIVGNILTPATGSQTYPVQVNADGQMGVTVPWTNTTYSELTTTEFGLAKLGDGNIKTISGQVYGIAKNANGQLCVEVPWTDTIPKAEDMAYATSISKGVVKLSTDVTITESPNGVNRGDAGRVYQVQMNDNNQLLVSVPWTDTVVNADDLVVASATGQGVVKIGSDVPQDQPMEPPQTKEGRTYPVQYNRDKQLVVNVPWTDTTLSDHHATANNYGTVMLGHGDIQTIEKNAPSYAANRTYPTQCDQNHNLVVNVPWTDTTYEYMTSSVMGLGKLYTDVQQSVPANAVTTTASRTYGIQKDAAEHLVVNVPWEKVETATSTYDGRVKLASDAVQNVAMNTITSNASRTYGIQKNGSGQLVVNVPWTDTVYPLASTTISGLMSNTDKTKLDGIASGAQVNVQSDWNATSGDAFIKNKPTSMPASDVYAWAKASSKPSYSWDEISGKPGSFYTLPTAADNTLGGIKTGYTTSGKNYKVQVDGNGNAYVNVPWSDTNTTYGDATSSASGLMSSTMFNKLNNMPEVKEYAATAETKTDTNVNGGNAHVTVSTSLNSGKLTFAFTFYNLGSGGTPASLTPVFLTIS